MKNPEKLIKDILRLKGSLEAQGIRLPPSLAGMYGEIIVFKRLKEILKKTDWTVNYFSGQSGADLQIVKGNKKINIEVKTSRLKEEGYGKWYGAALNIKKCRIKNHRRIFKHPKKGKLIGDFCYFDFTVFVTLPEKFSAGKFYVIPREFIEKNQKLLQNTDARFSSATHALHISNNGKMPTLPREQTRLITKTESYLNKWNLILSANR